MLWTKLDQDGDLTIQADVPIEAFALIQWEKQHKAGKAKLIIETGQPFDMDKIVKNFKDALGGDFVEFQKWMANRESGVVIVPYKDGCKSGVMEPSGESMP